MFGMKKQETEVIGQIVKTAIHDALTNASERIKLAAKLGDDVDALKRKLSELEIQKSQKEEEFARKQREVEHMVGLERKRSAFEKESATRDATLTVREENLKAEKKRFEDQMAFHDKRFTEEVGYLKEMIGRVLEAIPNVSPAPKKRGR